MLPVTSYFNLRYFLQLIRPTRPHPITLVFEQANRDSHMLVPSLTRRKIHSFPYHETKISDFVLFAAFAATATGLVTAEAAEKNKVVEQAQEQEIKNKIKKIDSIPFDDLNKSDPLSYQDLKLILNVTLKDDTLLASFYGLRNYTQFEKIFNFCKKLCILAQNHEEYNELLTTDLFTEALKTYKDRGIDITVSITASEFHAFHSAALSGAISLCKAFVNLGIDINSRDNFGSTPLHHAAFAGTYACAEALIALGADINIENPSGRTPLAEASRAECKDLSYNGRTDYAKTIDILCRNGADPKKYSYIDKESTYGSAITALHSEALRMLLAYTSEFTAEEIQQYRKEVLEVIRYSIIKYDKKIAGFATKSNAIHEGVRILKLLAWVEDGRFKIESTAFDHFFLFIGSDFESSLFESKIIIPKKLEGFLDKYFSHSNESLLEEHIKRVLEECTIKTTKEDWIKLTDKLNMLSWCVYHELDNLMKLEKFTDEL